MYPRKRYATRRAVSRYRLTYIPYRLQQQNNELKFTRAKRVNSAVLLYVYTSTPPQQYQYVPKETVRHQASCEEVYTYVYPASLAARYRGCMPISPADTTWQDGGTQVRTQLPLRLCWAITMHKSQVQTLDKAVIDLGPKEACTGLTFVCLSRAKRLVDLMVEPMSFDSIGNLGNYVYGNYVDVGERARLL